MSELPALNIALRGHVRDSLSNSRLKDFLGMVSDSFRLSVFAHTWDVQQNSLSWRDVQEIPNQIDEEAVRSYLDGFDVISVEIGRDGFVNHPGSIEGTIGRTRCPILGWKNMYYGKVRVCSLVSAWTPPESVTMQMRFDLLSNPFKPKENELLNFAKREFESLSVDPGSERIRFLRMHCFLGIDNVYIARIGEMSRFVSYMYYDMDRILVVHKNTIHQEHIAFHERMSFLNYEAPSQSVD